MGRQTIPRYANVVSLHIVYKVKSDNGKLKLKERIVPHGNRDSEKYTVRKDSASADMFLTRLFLSIGVMMGLKFAVVDMQGAYMKSGPIRRDIYVGKPA